MVDDLHAQHRTVLIYKSDDYLDLRGRRVSYVPRPKLARGAVKCFITRVGVRSGPRKKGD